MLKVLGQNKGKIENDPSLSDGKPFDSDGRTVTSTHLSLKGGGCMEIAYIVAMAVIALAAIFAKQTKK